MTNRLRASGILLLPYLVLAAGCNRVPPLRPYDRPLEGEVTPAEAEPLVIVGIAEGDEKIGKLVRTRYLRDFACSFTGWLFTLKMFSGGASPSTTSLCTTSRFST